MAPGTPGTPGTPVTARITVALTDEPIDVAAALADVADPACGGTALFLGTVRNHHEGAAVASLSYEAWEDQAAPLLATVAAGVAADVPEVVALHVVHRVGDLAIGDVAVVAAASAPHRDEAFRAARELIDRTKQQVPIWKNEHLADGTTRWVGADHPC